MMQAILKFDLNDVDDIERYRVVIAAENMQTALFKITCNLRNEIEKEIDNDANLINNGYNVLDRVFEEIGEICDPVNHILDL